jgi:oligoribonuclease NrnB/cAMP/cGMP phosphodiesterase (DHH superfamily)
VDNNSLALRVERGEHPEADVLVIHHNCPDGWAAAWVIRHYFKNEPGIVMAFHPTDYDEAPPVECIKRADTTYIVDFCYDRKTLEELSMFQTEILVLDHHKSMEAQSHGLDFCVFDMNRSGAGLAWDYFFPMADRPWAIDYIEDRDIWKWEFGNSREALAFLDTMPLSFATHDKLFEGVITLGEAVNKGTAIVDYIDQYLSAAIESGMRRIDFQDPSGKIHMDVPIVNVPYQSVSEAGNRMSLFSEFALAWFRRSDGKYKFSVRVSENSDFDASKFAKLYPGGGGHVKAAGFVLDHEIEELPTTAIENHPPTLRGEK